MSNKKFIDIHKKNELSTKKNLAIDWLTISCHAFVYDTESFKHDLKDYSTRSYRSIFEVYYNNDVVFETIANPFSSIIPTTSIQIKVKNNLLIPIW